MASLEIISYRDPGLLSNHLELLLHSNHVVPTATDLLAAFFDRATKFQNSKLVFIDMAIQVLITLNLSLDRSDLTESCPTIIHRLNELILSGAKSDWLSISEREGPRMTQIYRFIVRSATSDSKATREMLETLLRPALSSLAIIDSSKDESGACIAMELAEYYLMRADFNQARALLIKASALFDQSNTSGNDQNSRFVQSESIHRDPDKRISKPRLVALLQAAGQSESPALSGDDDAAFVAQLLDPLAVCPNFTDPFLWSFWNFLRYATPIDLYRGDEKIEKNSIQFVGKVVEKLQNASMKELSICHEAVERLQMWLEHMKLAASGSSSDMTVEPNDLTSDLPENLFSSVHSRADLIECVEFAFMKGSESMLSTLRLSGKNDDILTCAIQIAQKSPETITRLLLDSEKSSIAERFMQASPSTAFTIAALFCRIGSGLQQSPLNIDMGLFGDVVPDVNVKRLLSKLRIPPSVLRAKLLKCLREALISSLSISPDIFAHLKAIAIVMFADSDFPSCARVLLTLARIDYTKALVNTAVLTEPKYFEMLITSLSQIGEYFDAAVLCQLDTFVDLERGARLLMTSPRRFQTDLFPYILYPELVEALVYAFDKISPDNNKKQAALNLMLQPIMVARRNNPDRVRLLNDFVMRMLLNPRYTSFEHISLVR